MRLFGYHGGSDGDDVEGDEDDDGDDDDGRPQQIAFIYTAYLVCWNNTSQVRCPVDDAMVLSSLVPSTVSNLLI